MDLKQVKQVLADAPVGVSTSGERIVKWLADRDQALAALGELDLVSLELLTAIEALHKANSALFHYGIGGSMTDSPDAAKVVDETIVELTTTEQKLRDFYKANIAP